MSIYEIEFLMMKLLRDAIDNMKNKFSRDVYDMNGNLIKGLKELLIFPLTKLINQSIRLGIYPDSFKITKILPLYKKGDADEVGNYRPIALVPVISKV